MKSVLAVFVFLGVSAVAAPTTDENSIKLTPEQRQACRDEGGCTVFTRDALIGLIRKVQAADEKACRNQI